MEVKSLFDKKAYQEIMDRLDNLSPESVALWAKMNVSQLLTHCKRAFRVPLSEEPLPRMFVGRLFSWVFKAKLYNDKPFDKNLPTSPSFIVKDERQFEKERQALTDLVEQFHTKGRDNIGLTYPHPFFGKLTKDQWGISMWKHIDHHLRQFGV